MDEANPPAVSDQQVKTAIGLLVSEPHRRLLGTVLSDAPSPPASATVRETLPAALKSVLQRVDSQGEGGGAYTVLRASSVFSPLLNAAPDQVFRVAAQALGELPLGNEPHRVVVEAAFRRARTASTQRDSAIVVLPRRSPFPVPSLRLPETMAGHA